MKLGFAPLRSAWIELSNDVHFAVSLIWSNSMPSMVMVVAGPSLFLGSIGTPDSKS